MEALFWPLAILGLLLTGISKSGFAGGAGVLAVPLLALVMPVPQAAALTLPLLIIMDGKALWLYRRDLRWAELAPLLPAAIIGIALGGILLARIPEAELQILLGALSVAFALWSSLSAYLAKLTGKWTAGFWASLSGLTSTLLHAGGPPINMYLITRNLPKLTWLATATGFFAFMNVAKLIPYTLNQQWQWQFLPVWLVLIPVAILGVWIGYWIQTYISEKHFLLVCRILLLLSGLSLIVKNII